MANLFNHFQSALEAFTKEVHDTVVKNAKCVIEDSGASQNAFYVQAYRADIEIKVECFIFLVSERTVSVSFTVNCPFTGKHKREWSCMPIDLDAENLAASINCYL